MAVGKRGELILCGHMKKNCNILSKSKIRIRFMQSSLSASLEDQTEKLAPQPAISINDIRCRTVKSLAFLTDVGTEELAHQEMIAAILYQLTKNLSMDEIKKSGFDTYFVDHTTGIYPVSAAGVPFTASYLAVKGDLFADLNEDLAAEQKARVTYDNILRLVDDPDVRDPIKFLRQREVTHYQRFGDALRVAQDNMNSKNYYAYNPEFD